MWLHVPFRNREKNAYHKFHDFAAEAAEFFEYADALERPSDASVGQNVETEQPAQVLHGILDLISRMKTWMRDSKISGLSGPFRFPNIHIVTRNQLDRATARGYPTKLPSKNGWTFDAIQGQRLMHVYWTVLLDLYMTILDNAVLISLLDHSEDLQAQLLGEFSMNNNPAAAQRQPRTLLAEDCQRLANEIALYSTVSCHTACQSFGSLVSIYTLETALRWYEHHDQGTRQMDVDLEQCCRAILSGIRTQESKDPCAFEVAILPEDVLRRHWC
jgi:hypothetical protein